MASAQPAIAARNAGVGLPGTSVTSTGEIPWPAPYAAYAMPIAVARAIPVYASAATARAAGMTTADPAMPTSRATKNGRPAPTSGSAMTALASDTNSPHRINGRARVLSPMAPPTSTSTAVVTDTIRTSPSRSGRARIAACVVEAIGA